MLVNTSLKSLLRAAQVGGITVSTSKLINDWRPHACRDFIYKPKEFTYCKKVFVEENLRVEDRKSIGEVLNELLAPIVI